MAEPLNGDLTSGRAPYPPRPPVPDELPPVRRVLVVLYVLAGGAAALAALCWWLILR